MIRFSFRAGLVFVCGGVRYTLVERLVTGKLRLESSNEEQIDLPPDDINRRWLSGEWVLDQSSLSLAARATYLATPADLAAMPPRDRATIERKLAYLLRIERGQRAAGLSFTSSSVQLREDIEAVAAETKDPCKPSPATVWRWWKRYSVTRCPSSLRRRPYARRATAPTIKALFQEAIAEVFMTRQRKPRLEVWEALSLKVHRFNAAAEPAAALTCPSRATVYRWVNSLDPVLVHRAREGHKSAARVFRVALQGPRPKRILERVEIDHTPLDLLIIDKATRLLLGRPWVTFVIDVRSRCVLGFYVGFRAPAATSVLLALRQAMLPKDLILSRYPDVQAHWPCRGVPDLLVCDNGMELHADAVRAICYQMGVELQYCGVAHPEMKAPVERVFRTLGESLIHRLPGTTFSNPHDRGDYASENTAALDLRDFTHILVKWLVDQYHRTPHRGLSNRTPLEVWQQGEAERVIEMPAYPQQLDLMCGATEVRSLFHYGIEVDNLRYNSVRLQEILGRTRKGLRVELRYFEEDVGAVSVLDPKRQEFFSVPAVDAAYAQGLHRGVHRLVMAEMNRRRKSFNLIELLEIKAEIQSLVTKAVAAKKRKTRKLSAVLMGQDSDSILAGRHALQCSRESIDLAPAQPAPLAPGLDDALPEYSVVPGAGKALRR